MVPHPVGRSTFSVDRSALVFLLTLAFLWIQAAPGNCEQEERPRRVIVQALQGHIDPNEREIYRLENLSRGDVLYVYMKRLSGNLDPLFAIADGRFEMKMFDDQLAAGLKETPRSPHNVFRDLLDSFYLAWDDDSGKGTDAALRFPVPASGNYKLVVAGSRQPEGREITGMTFGSYRLLVGLNSPRVLTGKAASSGPAFARLEYSPSALPRIQKITSALTMAKNATYFRLANMDAGTTLYVQAEATSGDLKPALTLRNYGNKIIKVDNWQGLRKVAKLQYTFEEPFPKGSLIVSGGVEQAKKTSGEFRLLIGINTPEVMGGKGQAKGRPIITEPIQVGVAVQMDEITGVNQREENFGVAGGLTLRWRDPAFAYNPDTCRCSVKVFNGTQFEKFGEPSGTFVNKKITQPAEQSGTSFSLQKSNMD